MIPRIYTVGGKAPLLVIPTDRFKSEYFSVRFALPLTRDTVQKYSILTRLLRRATERYRTKAAFNRRLDDLYASDVSLGTVKEGDTQIISLSADFLGARYVGGGMGIIPQVLDMVTELLYHPYLPNGQFHLPYFEAEKDNLRDALRAEINAPRAFAKRRCLCLLLGDEPHALRLGGEEETIDALDAAELATLWQATMREIIPIFSYVGNSSPEALISLLEERFVFGNTPSTIPPAQNGLPTEIKREDLDMPISQGRLVLGYRTDLTSEHPLYSALLMAEYIYGASASSKLFLNVREKRSLCYYCTSTLNVKKGYMLAESGIKPTNRVVAEEAMHEEFLAICRGEISDTELENAKLGYDHLLKKLYDSPSALARVYTRYYLQGQMKSIEEARAAIAAVDKDSVCEAARHFREGAVFFLNATGAEGEAEYE